VQIKSLLRHISIYSLGSLVVTLAGFISFPILTRLLGVDDYGDMSLVAVTLTFLVAVGKLGLQHSAIMFYSETKAGKNEWDMPQYFSTVIIGMCASGALVTACWLAISITAESIFWDHPTIVDIFIVASPLILTRVIQSGLNSILRAQEHSGLTALYAVLWRYGNLVFVIGGMLLIEASLKVFFIATVAAETVVLAAMAYTVLSREKIHVSLFSPKLYRYMALYGLPMLGYEMAGIFASMGDRYVIKVMLGAEELGKYAAAYNLSEYVSAIIVSSLAAAILPMYLRIWAERGQQATEEFLAKSLRLYVFAALPVAFGFSAVADNFIAIMASAAYREGAVTVPYIVMGMIVDGAIIILAAGLYLQRDSKRLLLALCFSSVLNLVLNIVLVPKLGIKGAAVATLVTYCTFAFIAWRLSSRIITIALPWKQVLRYGVFSVAMYAVVGFVSVEGEVLSLLSKVAVGGLFYAALVLLFDRDSKQMLRELLRREQ
jgi:O-antigen/teichoic acid export membrane protein